MGQLDLVLRLEVLEAGLPAPPVCCGGVCAGGGGGGLELPLLGLLFGRPPPGLLLLGHWNLGLLLWGVRCRLDCLDMLLLTHCSHLRIHQVDLLLRTWAWCLRVSIDVEGLLDYLLDRCWSLKMEVVEAVATFETELD